MESLSLVQRFEDVARTHADRIAVETDDERISYAELDRRANRIAHAVAACEPARDAPVAMLLGQGPRAVAAILGVLKAGRAWVPLDPTHPTRRNLQVIEGAGAALLLTDREGDALARALAGSRLPVELVDALDAAFPDDRPGIATGPDDTAYVFYTSGSTGEPKGVFDSHRNVAHNAMRYTTTLGIGCEDRLTLVQSCSFSGTVSSLFGALLNGACLLPFDLRDATPLRLAEWLERRGATLYHSVPSLLRSVLQAGEHRFDSLRVVRLEGDTASPRDAALARTRIPDTCRLVNGLGTTETGLVTQYFVPPEGPPEGTVLPVGTPVADMQVLVVDEDRAALPAGAVGEIAVRSRYLARGYWRRPDLTAERFLGPASPGAERTYLTGDRGRLRADGCLEHLGRVDSRVRLRGQAVELAEVEAALQALAGVRDAAVAVHPGEGGEGGDGGEAREPQLVAYLVPDVAPAPRLGELRRLLAASLPAARLPNRCVVLDALPLSADGKLDRRSLPAPGAPDTGRAPRPARTLVEEHLVGTWREILGSDAVSATDDFFELGGESLQALAMLDRIERSLGVRLPPSVLLQEATIESLARVVRRGAPLEPVVALQEQGGGTPFYFLHGDYLSGGLYCRPLLRAWEPRHPVFALTPMGLDRSPLPASFEEMARWHLAKLRAHRPRGPYRLGGQCNGGMLAYEMARQLAAEGETVDRLVLVSASAENLRFRALRSAVEGLARLGAGAELRAALFRRLRTYAVHRESEPWPVQIAATLARLGRVPGALGEVRRERSAPADAADSGFAIGEAYHRLDAIHMPGRYAGDLALIAAEDDPEGPRERAACWGRICDRVELHGVPGTHISLLTRHVERLARALQRSLA